MEKNRLFTFGCSHTQYKWPTWADIIGLSFDEYYNFGRPGTGIFYMLYQFTFANEHFNFNEDDTLIFMLSNEARLDIVKEDSWLSEGFVFNSMDVFGKQFFNHYSLFHAVESSYIYVYFLKEVLDKIGCKYELIYAFPPIFENNEEDTNKNLLNVWNKKYNLTNKNIISLSEYSEEVKDHSYILLNEKNKKIQDGHFKISTHLNYVKKYLSKYYDTKNNDLVDSWIKTMENIKSYLEVDDVFNLLVTKNSLQFVNGYMKTSNKKKLIY